MHVTFAASLHIGCQRNGLNKIWGIFVFYIHSGRTSVVAVVVVVVDE